MNEQQINEILAKSYAQQLLRGPDPIRLAYDGLDGDPRVVPIGFWLEDGKIAMATTERAPKVAALRAHPKVAITLDTSAFPPKVLLIRGTVELETVQGCPQGYLDSGRKFMTEEQYVDWAAGVQGLYDEMVVITVTPTWVKLLDFETTIPQAVEELVREKTAGQ